MIPKDMLDECIRLSRLIDTGVEALRQQSEESSLAENVYRKAKAEAWVRCPTSERGGDWPATRRQAWVEAETADLRYKRDLADGLKRAALEAVRARQSQLSALQSVMSAHRAEAELVRTGPEMGP